MRLLFILILLCVPMSLPPVPDSQEQLPAGAQNATPVAALLFPNTTTHEGVRRNPPPRGTPVVVKARNGAELSGMFYGVDGDSLDLLDVSRNRYEVVGANVESVFLPEFERLTAADRERLGKLEPEAGEARELKGTSRVYLWAGNDAAREAIAAELNAYGDLKAAASARDADLVLYFAGRNEPLNSRSIVPQFFGRLYAYTFSDGKRLRVVWHKRREYDMRTQVLTRAATIASGARTAADLARDFVKEHRRQAAATP